ncbi:MAG TPA: glutamine-hydrolyzing carbamoyl-phosphate synthase small subunit [Candidatus Saccharimonadales bacterium]|nr:glutamine-hydrolyzing carbamoyl-phosphate synthase small subunit [Candidatus Saccharimonadales bacterium]
MEALLVLEDGKVFRGRSFGAAAERGGEVVFNTSMTGYQEVLTDPSYRGQIVVMTFPEIGNYGVNDIDVESRRIQVEGFVIRECSEIPSSWRARMDLQQYLRESQIPALSEIDTRSLTRHLRSGGVLRGILSALDPDPESLLRKVRSLPRLEEIDLVGKVSVPSRFQWRGGGPNAWLDPDPAAGNGIPNGKAKRGQSSRSRRSARHNVVALDYGMKENILRRLTAEGCRVTVLPAGSTADEVLGLAPDGVFLSNGPGDPGVLAGPAEMVRELLGRVPIFGICLGHQVMSMALGARTFKLKFGHRGGNHPVKNLSSGRVEITSQNHGYAVDPESLPAEVEITHVNLNDGTVEGFRHRSLPAFSVQYHPEASPGPHDAHYLFTEFTRMMTAFREGTPAASGGRGRAASGGKT